jgi:DNA-binding MarR family transcriptional regulator
LQDGPVQLQSNIPPLRRATTALARRFHQICMTIVGAAMAEAEVTPLQFGVLAYLNGQDGEPGIDQNGLASRLGIERSHVSLLVEELGSRGLLDRHVNGADRRARVLQLTIKGEKLYRRLLPGNIAANDRILEPLAPRERKLLQDMLIRIIQRHGASARPGGGRRKRRSRHSSSDKSQASSVDQP